MVKKRRIPWNKNIPCSKETKEKISKANKGKFGEKASNWKNGKTGDGQGYILIYCPQHPFHNKRRYVFEHRLIIEKFINRYLLQKEHCHHLNEIKDDNRPENLMAFKNQSTHNRFHKDPDNVKPEEIIFDGRKLLKI